MVLGSIYDAWRQIVKRLLKMLLVTALDGMQSQAQEAAGINAAGKSE
jgi:hypothetical protein